MNDRASLYPADATNQRQRTTRSIDHRMKRIAPVTPDQDPAEQAKTFLATLFGDVGMGQVVLSGKGENHPWTDGIATADLTEPSSLVVLADQAADFAHNAKLDVYAGMHVSSDGRRGAEHVAATPAVWTEFDFAGSSDKKAYQPWNDAAEVREFVNERIGMQPTMIVSSGNGLHYYWKFDEALSWWGDDAIAEAEAVLSRWEGWLQHAAKECGHGLDSVVDMGRVLRVPGTLNYKRGEARPVEIVSISEHITYSINDMLDVIPEQHQGRSLLRSGGAAPHVDLEDASNFLDEFGEVTTPEGEKVVARAKETMNDASGGRHFAMIKALGVLIQPQYMGKIAMRSVLMEMHERFLEIKPVIEHTSRNPEQDDFVLAIRYYAASRYSEKQERDLEQERREQMLTALGHTSDRLLAGSGLGPTPTELKMRFATGGDGAPWDCTDLAGLIADGLVVDKASVLFRQDLQPLFYAGKRNVIFGQPETGKTWVALLAAKQEIEAATGDMPVVVWLDYEDTPTTFLLRLRTLGVAPALAAKMARYFRSPNGVHGDMSDFEIDPELVKLVVVDSWNESMVAIGFNPIDAAETIEYRQRFLERLVEVFPNAAHVAIDHTPKADSSTQYGSYAKRSGLDGTAIRMTVIEHFRQGHRGAAKITIDKDRQGSVRKYQEDDGWIGTLIMEPVESRGFGIGTEDRVDAFIAAPSGASAVDADLRNAVLTAVADGDLSKNQIADMIGGRKERALQAIDVMYERGQLGAVPKGNYVRYGLPENGRNVSGTRQKGGSQTPEPPSGSRPREPLDREPPKTLAVEPKRVVPDDGNHPEPPVVPGFPFLEGNRNREPGTVEDEKKESELENVFKSALKEAAEQAVKEMPMGEQE